MSKPSIPQFCCATCKHWNPYDCTSEPTMAFGFCGKNTTEVRANQLSFPVRQQMQTLDLAVCTAWEKSDNAEEVMYGKRG